MENAPGRMKPRRARAGIGRGDPEVTCPNRQESNERAPFRRSGGRLGGASELARGLPQGGRPWSEAASGGTRTRREPFGTPEPPVRSGPKGKGRATGKGSPFPLSSGIRGTRGANRKRGCVAERRTRPLPGQALKGEPRGRARLRHTGEAVQGARRRGGQEPRGRNVTRGVETPGVVALDGRVVPMGKQTSRERSVRQRPRTGMPG
jgi:hypothetical protein